MIKKIKGLKYIGEGMYVPENPPDYTKLWNERPDELIRKAVESARRDGSDNSS